MTEREKLIDILRQGYEKKINLLEFEKEILADWLLENGVVILPVKFGDTVYLTPKFNGRTYCGVVEDRVQMIGLTSRSIHIKARNHKDFGKTYILGKTAFLTREDAEKALKGEN